MGPDNCDPWGLFTSLEAMGKYGGWMYIGICLVLLLKELTNPYDKYLPPTKRKYTNEPPSSEEEDKRKDIIPLPVDDTE